MLDLSKSTLTLAEFKRDAEELLKSLKHADEPLVLTVKGKKEAIMFSMAAYRRLLKHIDRLETLEGLLKALRDVEEGRTISLEEFKAHMRQKYGIQS